MKAGDVETVRLSRDHIGAYAEFVRRTWDPTATSEDLEAALGDGGEATGRRALSDRETFICLSGGKVVGQVGTIPIELLRSGREEPAHWIKGLWVLPEFQGTVVAFLLMKEVTEAVGGPQLVLAVRRDVHRLLDAVGFRDVGEVPNFVRPIDASRILRRARVSELDSVELPPGGARLLDLGRRTGLVRAGGAALQAAVDARAVIRAGVSSSPDVRLTDRVPVEACDGLWETVRSSLTASPVRDGTYLRERYSLEGDGHYTFVEAREGTDLVGFAALRRPGEDGDHRLGGVRVASLSELVFRPGDRAAGLGLIRGAVEGAREVDADAVFCSATDESARDALGRGGFFRIGGNMHLLFRPADGEADRSSATPCGLADWWITRGDGYSDENF